ncbi:MAG: alpha-1,2-fucosyltransferase [Melioribacteraceae bacterium]
MGNQMFQYALGRVLSIKNNVSLVLNIQTYEDKNKRLFKSNFTIRSYDLDVFNIQARIAQNKEIPFIHRMYWKGKIMIFLDAIRRRILKHNGHELVFEQFDPKFLELGPNTYLDGYFQSFKYFEGFEDILKKDFSLKEIINKNIQDLANEIKKQNSLCIHIRRTDFVGNSYHEIVDKEYYNRGIEYIRKIGKIDKIYVFSDDIRWCKENIRFEFPTMFVGQEYVGKKNEGHLFLMSVCKYFVIPNSTFSWWGAWLSKREDKIVIAPTKWVRDESVDINDIIEKGWVKI